MKAFFKQFLLQKALLFLSFVFLTTFSTIHALSYDSKTLLQNTKDALSALAINQKDKDSLYSHLDFNLAHIKYLKQNEAAFFVETVQSYSSPASLEKNFDIILTLEDFRKKIIENRICAEKDPLSSYDEQYLLQDMKDLEKALTIKPSPAAPVQEQPSTASGQAVNNQIATKPAQKPAEQSSPQNNKPKHTHQKQNTSQTSSPSQNAQPVAETKPQMVSNTPQSKPESLPKPQNAQQENNQTLQLSPPIDEEGLDTLDKIMLGISSVGIAAIIYHYWANQRAGSQP